MLSLMVLGKLEDAFRVYPFAILDLLGSALGRPSIDVQNETFCNTIVALAS